MKNYRSIQRIIAIGTLFSTSCATLLSKTQYEALICQRISDSKVIELSSSGYTAIETIVLRTFPDPRSTGDGVNKLAEISIWPDLCSIAASERVVAGQRAPLIALSSGRVIKMVVYDTNRRVIKDDAESPGDMYKVYIAFDGIPPALFAAAVSWTDVPLPGKIDGNISVRSSDDGVSQFFGWPQLRLKIVGESHFNQISKQKSESKDLHEKWMQIIDDGYHVFPP